MSMYGLKEVCNRLILSSSSTWTNVIWHWVKLGLLHGLFFIRGKVKPLKILRKNAKSQQILYDIGVSPTITASTSVLLSEWTCLTYGRNRYTNVDDERQEIFLQKYSTNTITSVKNLDGNILPICSRVLLQKVRRTKIITRRRLAAT